MKFAAFTSDATPPVGHPLCGGWITPAREIVDRQYAHGLLIQPDGQAPIVLIAVDWCWIRTAAHRLWRERVAEAVGTEPTRVSVHCVHQHDAIMADTAADAILAARQRDLRTLIGGFFEEAVRRCAEAALDARKRLRSVTHIGRSQAVVSQVASNRRILRPDGKVGTMRGSSCKDPKLRAAPEGLIDPFLKCITLWDGRECLAGIHYYATHPMSYYGQGGVSADFVGMARSWLREQTNVPQIYFTGAAGNIAAGKYNDGSPEMRPILAERMFHAMQEAFETSRPQAIEAEPVWSTRTIRLPMNPEFDRKFFEKQLTAQGTPPAIPIKGAMGLAWWDWHEAGHGVDVSALRIGETAILHLPSEAFIEYQLYAQGRPTTLPADEATSQPTPELPADARFVACAAYGDCGPAYIPTDAAFPQGGYEVSMAWVGPGSEAIIKQAIDQVLHT